MIGTGLIVLSGCQSGGQQNKGTDLNQDTTADTVSIPAGEEALKNTALIPGSQAGKLSIGQDMEQVAAVLGKPVSGDAAMGSTMGIWHLPLAQDLADTITVFGSYRDSTMSVKEVRQITVTGKQNQTAEGLHTGVKLEELQKIYPELKLVQSYVKEKGEGRMQVYAQDKAGIAFDIINGNCTAITIYPKEKKVNQIYLPARAGWKTAP